MIPTPIAAWRALALAATLALGSIAEAQIQFNIQVDTHSLISNANGPFSLDFQLNDGSALGDGNNTATIGNFDFGGGWATGAASTFGDASGDLGSWVTLTDSQPFNELFQGFMPGDTLSFTVMLSTNVDWPTPDEFTFAILDGNLMNLPTTAPASDALVQVDLDSASPTVMTFATLDGSVTATPVPEASTYGLLGAGLLAIVAAMRRRKN